MKKLVAVLVAVLLIGVGSVVAFDSPRDNPHDLDIRDIDLSEKLESFEKIQDLDLEEVNLEALIDELIDVHSEVLELEGIENWQDIKERFEEAGVIVNMEVVLHNIEIFDLEELEELKEEYGLTWGELASAVDVGENLYGQFKDDEVIKDIKEIFEIGDEDIEVILDMVKDKLDKSARIENRIMEVEEILQSPQLIEERKAMSLEDKIFVRGERLSFEDTTNPVIKNDRTLIPVRAVSESLDADVSWNDEKRVVTIEKGQTTIKLEIGEKEVTVIENDTKREEMLDVAVEIKDDRTMVPLRFVSEVLGESVKWYEQTGEIDIGLE